jgi:glycosyltransferase involved in cell wall biosynthesis
MYETFFYHKEFLKKYLSSCFLSISTAQGIRVLFTFVAMKMKKVIVSVSSDLVTDNRVDRSCTTLCQLGYDVQLIGRKKKSSPPLQQRDYACTRLCIKPEKGPFFYLVLNVRLFFTLLFKKADLLFANDLDTLLANFLVSKLRRLPLIYDSHELFTEAPELIHRPKIQSIWKLIERLIFPKLSYVITVNKSIAAIFEAQYRVPVSVIRNVPRFQPHIEAFDRKSLGLSETDLVVIVQGSGLNIERGIEESIIALKEVAHIQLLIVGDGDVLPKAKALVEEAQLHDKVRFIGRVPYLELLRYTALADIGLALDKPLSKNYELALPNKVFDYLQAQTAILASPLIEIQGIIQQYKCGVVIEEVSPACIAKALKRLQAEPEKLLEMKQNARKAALTENWEHEQQVLEALMKQACPIDAI